MRISDWSSDVCSSDLILDHQSCGRLGASHHAGNSRPRMRARSNEIEIVDHIVAIMCAEKGALRQRGLQRKGAAQMCAQVMCEIRRSIVKTGDRKSVVEGRSVSVGVDLGGSRSLKKKKKKNK